MEELHSKYFELLKSMHGVNMRLKKEMRRQEKDQMDKLYQVCRLNKDLKADLSKQEVYEKQIAELKFQVNELHAELKDAKVSNGAGSGEKENDFNQ